MLLSCEIGQPKENTRSAQNVVKHRCDHRQPPSPPVRLPTSELVIEDHQSPNTIVSLLFSKYCHTNNDKKIVRNITYVYFSLPVNVKRLKDDPYKFQNLLLPP